MKDHFEAQCRKCGRMREIKDPRLVMLKNLKRVIHGHLSGVRRENVENL